MERSRTDGQCHRCPASEAVKTGKYSDHPFENTPCFACREVDYRQFPHRGRTVVSFEATPPFETATPGAEEHEEGSASDQAERFVDFLRECIRDGHNVGSSHGIHQHQQRDKLDSVIPVPGRYREERQRQARGTEESQA